MMGFTEDQNKALSAKLSGKYVRSREKDGVTLSYIEGWHAIAEADRIFGFDGWDRETLKSECVWQGKHNNRFSCTYVSKVGIRVRAGDVVILREGSGCGTANAENPGDAHGLAVKEAETDAMKRALMTFGNPFGLALYDKDKTNVTKIKPKKQITWSIQHAPGNALSRHADPTAYCAEIRRIIEMTNNEGALKAFWKGNREVVENLRTSLPELRNHRGWHYADLLAGVFTKHLDEIKASRDERVQQMPGEITSPVHSVPESKESEALECSEKTEDRAITKSKMPLSGNTPDNLHSAETADTNMLEKGLPRIRNKNHLHHVASLSCLICGREPAQAHHLTHAQPKAMSRKSGDQWTVPLCAIHHRQLHDNGNEAKWWKERKIDALNIALELWSQNIQAPGLTKSF
jgi:DNA recombination protein Rad52